MYELSTSLEPKEFLTCPLGNEGAAIVRLSSFIQSIAKPAKTKSLLKSFTKLCNVVLY